MRKLFSEKPVLAVFFSSCLVFMALTFFVTMSFFWMISKAFSGLSENTELSMDSSSGAFYKYIAGSRESENEFLSIPIQGIILTSQDIAEPYSFLVPNFTYGYSIKNQLIAATVNDSIKGIVLEIDSPGGTITGAKAIYDGIMYYKNVTHKPVVAHISGLSASGAYYAILPSDVIMADQGSLTGSIGVIMGPFKYYDSVISEGNIFDMVTTENGIQTTYFTAGEDKDFGNPYKPLSEKATKVLQQNLDNEYETFVDLVAGSRNISRDTIVEDIGALIYDNEQAKNYKLIDSEGNRQDSYANLADLAGVNRGDFKVITQRHLDFWTSLLGVTTKNIQKPTAACILCDEMLYLHGPVEKYLNK